MIPKNRRKIDAPAVISSHDHVKSSPKDKILKKSCTAPLVIFDRTLTSIQSKIGALGFWNITTFPLLSSKNQENIRFSFPIRFLSPFKF